jgi:hypothetical protein
MRTSQTLIQELTFKQKLAKIVEIVQEKKRLHRFIRYRYSDGEKGRCTLGLLLTYYGWSGNPLDDSYPSSNSNMFDMLSIHERNLIASINYKSYSYDEVVRKLTALAERQ